MDAGRAKSSIRESVLAQVSRPALQTAVAVLLTVVLSAAGCGNSPSKFGELPDLATQAPAKQTVMSPTDQRKAIDELIAKRDKQAAEAASQEKAVK